MTLSACESEGLTTPKPSTYLRLELPKEESVLFSDECPYEFKLSKLYSVKEVEASCHKDIDLGPLNGVIHFSYIDMEESLASYVNFSIDKVDEHKIKATSILDSQIINTEQGVYGTFFELQGDVASPFQFYLTDSTERFVNAVVYFNSTPNYDSLRPTLNYLKEDLNELISTFKWKK